MGKDKGSFVVYTDLKEIVDDLDDLQVAALFRAMLEYQTTGKDPKLSGALKYIFIPIRQQMDRDAEKWEQTRVSRAENGRKGGLKSGEARAKRKEANEANASMASSNEANEAVNVTGTVTASVPVTATDTTTVTVQRSGSGGIDSVYGVEDEFNIWKMLTPEDVDQIYDSYPNSGGDLIQAVYEDVKKKRKRVGNAVPYILGYADKVLWDDNAEHGGEP